MLVSSSPSRGRTSRRHSSAGRGRRCRRRRSRAGPASAGRPRHGERAARTGAPRHAPRTVRCSRRDGDGGQPQSSPRRCISVDHLLAVELREIDHRRVELGERLERRLAGTSLPTVYSSALLPASTCWPACRSGTRPTPAPRRGARWTSSTPAPETLTNAPGSWLPKKCSLALSLFAPVSAWSRYQ